MVKTQKHFHPIKSKARIPSLTISIQNSNEFPVRAVCQEKEIKGIQIRKGVKLSVFR
jgi:hypothetical protein